MSSLNDYHLKQSLYIYSGLSYRNLKILEMRKTCVLLMFHLLSTASYSSVSVWLGAELFKASI